MLRALDVIVFGTWKCTVRVDGYLNDRMHGDIKLCSAVGHLSISAVVHLINRKSWLLGGAGGGVKELELTAVFKTDKGNIS